jgi:urea transport system ATP-binding protein
MKLTTDKLEFSYGMVQALRGVSMTMEPGRVTCVIGRNGVGKTTLMKTLMGLLKATSGAVSLDARNVTKLPASKRAKAGIALVPQGRQIFPKLTVMENLRVGLQARTDGVKTVPDELFEIFPVLKQMSGRMGGDLSGGQQQQLAIARALLTKPRLLILDEPTEGIQPSIIRDIGRAIEYLRERGGLAILLVEQYFEWARDLADDYAVLDRGAVVLSGARKDMDEGEVRKRIAV